MIKGETVIIGNAVEFIIRQLPTQNLLCKRQGIILLFIEHIPMLLAIIFHKAIVEGNVMPDQNCSVRKLEKVGKHLFYRRRADEAEMLAAAQEREEQENFAGEPAIELPADMEWDYLPLQPSEITPMEVLLQTESQESEESQEPEAPQETEPELFPEEVAPIPEPVVMTEERRQPVSQQKADAKAREPNIPQRTPPKRSGSAALYGTKIKRHASERMKRKGEDGQ